MFLAGCGQPASSTLDGGCSRDAAVDLGCGPSLVGSNCVAAGGTFLNPRPAFHTCLCPSSDYGCPCTASTECEGYCELRGASGSSECVYAEGTCTEFKTIVSCVCLIGEDKFHERAPYTASMICVE